LCGKNRWARRAARRFLGGALVAGSGWRFAVFFDKNLPLVYLRRLGAAGKTYNGIEGSWLHGDGPSVPSSVFLGERRETRSGAPGVRSGFGYGKPELPTQGGL